MVPARVVRIHHGERTYSILYYMVDSELALKIKSLYANGMSYRQIEKELGCSKSTISYHVSDGQKIKAIQRQRDARSRVAKFIQQLKQETPCADCRENYPYWIMEFDHLPDSIKEFNVSEYRQRTISLEKIKIEIDKCELVCANCHRTRTHYRGIKTRSWCLDVFDE